MIFGKLVGIKQLMKVFSWPPKEASSWNPKVSLSHARSLFPTEILNFEARTLKLET